MTERYRYEPGTLSVSAFRAGDEEWNDLDEQEDIEGFMIFDIIRGHGHEGSSNWIAFSRNREDAARIAHLLNLDERLKTQAAMGVGGKEPT